MALATDVTLDWADATYRFALPIAQLEELDDKTGAGPVAVLTRLIDRSWRLPDLRDTIRLGLIGGGTQPAKALTLVRRYVDGAPLQDSVPIATAILIAAIRGRKVEGADAGNGMAATSRSDPTGSTSPRSDATPS